MAETEDAVTLEFQMVDQPDWSPTLERGGDRFVKALGAHWCQIDFPARHATSVTRDGRHGLLRLQRRRQKNHRPASRTGNRRPKETVPQPSAYSLTAQPL
jgi:hypothetical protein